MASIQAGASYALKGPKGKPPTNVTVTEVKRKGLGYTVHFSDGKKPRSLSLAKFRGQIITP